MTNKFKAGDVVTCTEHSHPMTVERANGSIVCCSWIEDSAAYANDYSPEDLTLSDEQPTPDLNLGGGE